MSAEKVKLQYGGLSIRGEIAWKVCKSENVQEFERELTTSLPDLNGVKLSPVYACQSVLVCLRSSSFPRATFSHSRKERSHSVPRRLPIAALQTASFDAAFLLIAFLAGNP
jgi:hypothetical protein